MKRLNTSIKLRKHPKVRGLLVFLVFNTSWRLLVFLTSTSQSGEHLNGWVPMAVTLSVYLGMHLYASL